MEVIVVLVILAILAAVSIPALTGFIQESKNKAAVRIVYVASRDFEVGVTTENHTP